MALSSFSLQLGRRRNNRDSRWCHSQFYNSFEERTRVEHKYIVGDDACPPSIGNLAYDDGITQHVFEGIRGTNQGLAFDRQGRNLASTLLRGCLTVFDSRIMQFPGNFVVGNNPKPLIHVHRNYGFDRLKWNPRVIDQVACSSIDDDGVHIFDLRTGQRKILTKNIVGGNHIIPRGFTDIDFSSQGEHTWIYASDFYVSNNYFGTVYCWDVQGDRTPMRRFLTMRRNRISRMVVFGENEKLFAVDEQGLIFMWDLRQIEEEGLTYPIIEFRLPYALHVVRAHLNIQERIAATPTWIGLNRSNPYQLGFLLSNGCTGVLNIMKPEEFQISHLFFPTPPLGYNGEPYTCHQPAWMSYSFFVVGSRYSMGLYFLDFSSRDDDCILVVPRFVPTSGYVNSCALNPITNLLAVGIQGDGDLLALS